jgi:hypothetical protein
MDEGGNLRPAVAGGLGGAPAQVIAEVTPGVAGYRRRHARRSRRHQQPLRWHPQRQRRRCFGQDGRSHRNVAADIGKEPRERIARPRLDAQMLGASGEAEHDQRIGPLAREQLRQFPVDCFIGNAKDMRDAAGPDWVLPAR